MKAKPPSAAEFPITFEHALRLAVGGRDVGNRFHIFRGWWKSELARMFRITGVHTDNTDEIVKYFRTNGVDAIWFSTFCFGIAEFKAAQGVEQRRAAANARWQKQKRPKKGLVRSSRGRK